jgi:branched-chain amino acid transport system substrate-binding protein
VTRKKLPVLIIALLALSMIAVLFASACGEEETTTTAGPTTTAGGTETTAPASTETTAGGTETTAATGEAGDDITIGAINSITGVNALTGAEHKWAQEKAAADWNAKGGLKLADGKMHKIVLKYYDDKSSDTEAAAAMEKLIKTDGIKVVLSSNTTPYNQAAATVAEQYQAYYHIVTSWTDFIGGMGLKWSSDFFVASSNAGKAATGAVENMTEKITKIAVMTENNPDGIGFGDGTVAGLEAAGYEVVSYEKFVEGQKDFSSIILKMQESGVEGIIVLISPSDGITFVKQLKEQNWAPKFMFGFKGFWPVEFMKGLGPDSEYICHDGFWSESLPFPGAKELGAAFTAEHDGATSVSVGLSYAGAQILFTAIERAGELDPAKVRDEVFGGTFPGTTMGDVTYSEEGIADMPLLGLQWIGGQRVVVSPKEFAAGPTQTMVPWDQR